jgi:divalent metal cation (Fe/Co/Zn/Cd) transporter
MPEISTKEKHGISDTSPAIDMNDSRETLLRRGLRLEVFTIAWNVVEGLVAVGAGVAAGSIALVGFGVDSCIEVTAGATLFWRMRKEASGDHSPAAEEKALRIVSVTFLLLAAYVAYEAVSTLIHAERPDNSFIGLLLSVVSLLIMPILGFAKLRTGRLLGSRALIADSKETFACSYLSFTLLLGLGVHWVFGWWWADPAAALLMVPWLVKEGIEGLRGEEETDE